METDKGVIGANLRAAQPTTDPQDLARSEMMRLICREADKSFFHFRGNYIGHLKEDETVEYYRKPPSDTLHALDSTPDGLTPEQAAARLARDGRNVLTEPPKPSLVKRFFQQLADPMILVLLAAALISAITSAYAHESFADVIIILIVVIINAVAPGVVNTDMVANMPQFAKDSVGDTIPMKRFAEPEDIANGILFLSSSAASYVTGVCLQIDGGYRPNNLPK